MKKPKFLFKVDHNNYGKVYINHKWLHDVTEINIHGEPWNYSVIVKQHKRNSKGAFYVENNEVATCVKEYHIGRKLN